MFVPPDEDYAKVVEKHPSLEHYPTFKKTKDVLEFITRYNEVNETPFPIAATMDAYCSNDVMILAHGMVAHRKRMLEITKNIDVLRFA